MLKKCVTRHSSGDTLFVFYKSKQNLCSITVSSQGANKRAVRKVRPKMLVLDLKRENSRIGRQPQPVRATSRLAHTIQAASAKKTKDYYWGEAALAGTGRPRSDNIPAPATATSPGPARIWTNGPADGKFHLLG
jgi:hypothetical protein